MGKYKFVIGEKENNFADLDRYKSQITELSKDLDLFFLRGKSKDEMEYSNPFGCNVLVVALDESQNELVSGFASLAISSDKGVLDSSFVRPENRREGLWSSMIKVLTEEADKRGVKELMSVPAIGDEFLRRYLGEKGFKKSSEGDEMFRRL